MNDPEGVVLCKKKFTATKLWPEGTRNPFSSDNINIAEEYKKSLAGTVVTVMEISVDGNGYLVRGNSEKLGPFLWMIEKEDTVKGSFLPIVKKYGTIMPAKMTPVEEFEWLAKHYCQSIKYHK